jgi:hypothetical protein
MCIISLGGIWVYVEYKSVDYRSMWIISLGGIYVYVEYKSMWNIGLDYQAIWINIRECRRGNQE